MATMTRQLLSLLLLFAVAHCDRVGRCLSRYTGLEGNASKKVYETNFPGVTWDEDNWLLTSTDLEHGRFQTRGSVANGYIGISLSNAGPFFEVDSAEAGGDVISGWPLFSQRQSFATVAGFFDAQPKTNMTNFEWLDQYGYESVISGVPHWGGIILDTGSAYLDSTVKKSAISNFATTYDFQAGVLSWKFTWKAGNASYDMQYRLFANKLHVNEAVVDVEIVSSVDTNATLVNVLEGYAAVRTDFVESGQDEGAIYTSVKPNGIANVTAYIYANMTSHGHAGTLVKNKPYLQSNDSSIAVGVPVQLLAGKAVRATKYVGVASSDAFSNPRETAKNATIAATKRGFYKSLRAHVKEWAAVMPLDSVDRYTNAAGKLPNDPYIIDSSVIAVANTYYLLQSTVGKNAQAAVDQAPVNVDSISVGGLASDSYAGLVFWDADLWMQPGLVMSHPESADRITNYRVQKYDQAKANVKTAYAGSQNKTHFSDTGAIYPWTSGRFGNCTGTGPCWDYQYHLNGDIALALTNQWVATGDTARFKSELFPVYDSIATMYAELLQPNGSSWTVTNMTDPVRTQSSLVGVY